MKRNSLGPNVPLLRFEGMCSRFLYRRLSVSSMPPFAPCGVSHVSTAESVALSYVSLRFETAVGVSGPK